MANTGEIIIFSAINDEDLAHDLITDLIEADLIISGTIFPEVTLLYKWEGKINMDQEVKMIIKAKADKYDAIEDFIMRNHPYKFPEVTRVDAHFGSEKFKEFCKSKPA